MSRPKTAAEVMNSNAAATANKTKWRLELLLEGSGVKMKDSKTVNVTGATGV